MNTTILEGAQDLKVRFHIGRGGHFNNAGHKTYIGTVNGLSDCFGESSIIDVDDNGDKLPDNKWQLVDGGGNVILTGRDKIESETGILDWDGEYDTDIVRKLSDMDAEHAACMLCAEVCDWLEMEKSVDLTRAEEENLKGVLSELTDTEAWEVFKILHVFWNYKADQGDMFQWALDVTWWPAWLPTELKESETADDDIIDEK